jgi:hypothetical protein
MRWARWARDTIGVRTISSTIIRITATVRCPRRDPSPSPTMNPTMASSSIHNPVLIMSEVDGYRNVRE